MGEKGRFGKKRDAKREGFDREKGCGVKTNKRRDK